MKTTLKQIEKAINNTFEIGVDGDQDTYEVIRLYTDEAIEKCGIKKSNEFFTKSDWKAVYRKIQKILAS